MTLINLRRGHIMNVLLLKAILVLLMTISKVNSAPQTGVEPPDTSVPEEPGGATKRKKDLDRTPVLPWVGVKVHGEEDCLDWESVAKILFSNTSPPEKKMATESKSCRLDHFLECVPGIEDKDANKGKGDEKTSRKRRQAVAPPGGGGTGGGNKNKKPGNSGGSGEGEDVPKTQCGCMIGMGKGAVVIDKMCYIPAGHGWLSECYRNLNYTPPETGLPVPYGDARGPGNDPNIEQDEIVLPGGNKQIIKYLDWNTIQYPCVPNAVCKEGATYYGKRCQCKAGSRLRRETWTCSKVHRILPISMKIIAIFVVAVFARIY